MKILKFGGKSLQTGDPLSKTIEIIRKESTDAKIAVVVSALGNSTDLLLELSRKAFAGADLSTLLKEFTLLQNYEAYKLDLDFLLTELSHDLKKAKSIAEPLKAIEDKILSYGELFSARIVAHLLSQSGVKAEFVDARNFLKGKLIDGEFAIDLKLSRKLAKEQIAKVAATKIPVITGFIAEDDKKRTVTLGRNGSNYSTSLIANFIDAEEVQNWTDVNGIYVASPKLVPEAEHITHLSYKEAHELANFGATILHPKTIGPLMEKSIPLKIFNSFYPDRPGTTVSESGSEKGIKAVSVIENVALISIEGKGLVGTIGIDARIFTALSSRNISVKIISQAASERGIGFVVDSEYAKMATAVLSEEFAYEILRDDISAITYNLDMAIIAIVGRHNYSLEKAIKGLRRNKIWMHLISNSISGEHISLVIDNKHIRKAVNIVHSQVFGVIKTINLFAIGKGTVGSNLIKQILSTSTEVEKRRNLRIRIIGIADSKKFIFTEAGINKNWQQQLAKSSSITDFDTIIDQLNDSALENIVIVDNTSSQAVAERYPEFLKNQFDVVASNKKANSGSYQAYHEIRQILNQRGRQFHYETNVGAGLPIIDTIKYLYDSADQVVKIRGVFSGSLSYIFNNFSDREDAFSAIVREAKELGLTEPDPREDLSGEDVARKLIILARELGLHSELIDIKMENLVPEELVNTVDITEFWEKKDILDTYFAKVKNDLPLDHVLRYVATLDVLAGSLNISIERVPRGSALGRINNSDALFEVYTESYGDQPIIIQGAGAGGAVTARGVYSDLIKLGHKY